MNRVVGGRAAVAVAAAGVAAAAALAAFGVFGASGASPRTGPLVVRAGLARAPGPFVRGDGIYDGKGARAGLGAAVSGALMGPLSPVAVESPDGSYVAYNTWRPLRQVDDQRSFSRQGIRDGDALGTPSLRVHGQGRDFLLAQGAYSVAWRADGAIAYVRGVDPDFRAGRQYAGQVVVQRRLGGAPVQWTSTPGRYVVYGWARNRLLFYRLGLGERLELLAADGAGDVRPLAAGSAIAISPDGTRVAVLGPESQDVRILDVATGREQAWVNVTTTAAPLNWVAYSGSWTGDHVVAPASSGLAVFHVGPDSIELEQALSLDHADFPVGVQEPRFADDAGNQVVATADVPPSGDAAAVSFFVNCDRIARTCERGAAAPSREWLRLVDNPSRPEEGGR
jgi:hypothetical protein